jgi:hypothetical protein
MRQALLYLLLALSSTAAIHSIAAETISLNLPQAASLEPATTSDFYEQALRLALGKTSDKDSDIQFLHHPVSVPRERARLLVKQGVLDIVWSSSNKEREQELVAVKFNLIRGINEYRLLLIRAEDQARFNKVNSLADLQQFRIGSGTHWSDTDVYRFNGMPLVTSPSYDPMFRMLKMKRFDYMARSLQEIDYEVKRYGNLGLAIEKNLAVHYPQPIYFFLKD